MINENLIKELETILGKEHVSTSPMDLKAYAFVQGTGADMIGMKPADVIVLPKNTLEVSKVVKLANKYKAPVVPRGAGTNSCGMNVAHKGGIVLDMSRISENLEIDEDNMVIVADAGCSVYWLMRELDKRYLRFPFMPLYTAGPQIGSAVSCNITGNYMTRYGSMGDNIVGLEVVMPTGEIITFGPGAMKTGWGHYQRYVGGPDLMGLFVNASGTMGVVTKVAVRIKPKPEKEEILCYGWKREHAKELTDAMYWMQRKFVYDFFLINRWNYHSAEVQGSVVLPDDVHFIAMVSVDAETDVELELEKARMVEIAEQNKAKDLGDLGNLTMGPPHYRIWLSVSKWMQRIEATYFWCPVKKFPEVYDIWEDTTRNHDFWDDEHCPAWFSFHGRNTCNPYPLLAKGNPTDEQELEKMKLWWNELNIKLCAAGCVQYNLGDSFPDHNYGVLGEQWNLTRKIKKFLDPNGIMNPSRTYGGL
jgi:FAD/FMN-containing dehydrogenase